MVVVAAVVVVICRSSQLRLWLSAFWNLSSLLAKKYGYELINEQS